MTASKLNRGQSRAGDGDPALPQRDPFIGPPAIYSGAPADVVERFADAVREWANQPVPAWSSRCRGVESPGIGRTNHQEA
ncbi:hypothetical protein OG874_39820 [Nocardia sp. NBC_00565]|uniref:hypothetical protein n=1 Tax=Nocardia sp. NBC_00565 TaxID=2975993 RepID=UPI002E815191|nr:hypothetical protein [Nocardia sp. NBC_00565]WUC02781.1 hypothetical protein OG874_39820 [Nocardia sp. NBC_00565]